MHASTQSNPTDRTTVQPYILTCPSSVAERLRRRPINQKIAGSNLASGHLATPFRKEI